MAGLLFFNWTLLFQKKSVKWNNVFIKFIRISMLYVCILYNTLSRYMYYDNNWYMDIYTRWLSLTYMYIFLVLCTYISLWTDYQGLDSIKEIRLQVLMKWTMTKIPVIKGLDRFFTSIMGVTSYNKTGFFCILFLQIIIYIYRNRIKHFYFFVIMISSQRIHPIGQWDPFRCFVVSP